MWSSVIARDMRQGMRCGVWSELEMGIPPTDGWCSHRENVFHTTNFSRCAFCSLSHRFPPCFVLAATILIKIAKILLALLNMVLLQKASSLQVFFRLLAQQETDETKDSGFTGKMLSRFLIK
jgi:hypothetical protein